MCGFTNSVFTYKREELLLLRSRSGEINNVVRSRLDFINNIIETPEELTTSTVGASFGGRRSVGRRRRRGKRGGVLARLRQRTTRPALPSIILANVRSLRNKMDELSGHIEAKRDLRDCCAYFITETWLDDSIPDAAMTLQGFTIFRSDRLFTEVNKTKGGNVCFFVNNQWCSDSKEISRSCTRELETLSIRCRPY